ncbi:hypothetical protein LCGC14_2158120 [marine sediment metagenome]|uniref:NAD-dependent epimerase/dehydratase domain-containing protein n=1 Tax=marine sediment metagenome TaxID=412755 RepID=A0A0F9G6E7_9ZZZZ
MKVLITGGTGSVGKAVTERLVRNGWDVLVVGRRSGIEIPGGEYAACDVTRFDDLREKIAGCDAVVHLAAIAGPHAWPGPEIIRVNVLGTFNVFEAAAAAGVRRIVQASSINAFGCWWGVVDLLHLQYFPIDEEHPTFTTDPYSFSKELIERVGEYYWRRDGISSVALRLPGVRPREHSTGQKRRERVQRDRALLDELAALPEGIRLERLAAAHEKMMAHRRQRPFQPQPDGSDVRFRHFGDDPLAEMYMGACFNFWASLDERDSAQAVEKGLTAEYEGSHVLFVNDSHNWLGYDTEKLLGMFFPAVTGRKRPIHGCESLVSIDRARDLIAFEPEHSAAV